MAGTDCACNEGQGFTATKTVAGQLEDNMCQNCALQPGAVTRQIRAQDIWICLVCNNAFDEMDGRPLLDLMAAPSNSEEHPSP